MKKKEYPVFLIKGFLDSGKTRFIRDAVIGDGFAQRGDTLVFLLEEGEEEYDEKLLAGIHGVEIKNLSTLVSELNGRKNELSIKLREVRDAIRDFEKDHNNIKLVPVIREKEFVEAKLSNIYNSLRDLKVKINRIKKQISDLEISLENYNSICEQIEHLEHELKN